MIISPENDYESLDDWFRGKQKVLLVCDSSFKYLTTINKKLETINTQIVRFSDFQPNPLYESVIKGVNVYKKELCDAIIAVGGGSAIDVAKCIKLFSGLTGNGKGGEWLRMDPVLNSIPFLAIPTTAGTGSEATRFAVVYYQGAKQSITSNIIIPDTVLLDPSSLKTLPLYQRKATMCDAFCHALESFWSINSNEESKTYSREAIEGIFSYKTGYLANTEEGNAGMLLAAHKAGQAINITQTTAGHAMCYKITSLFGCAHGHAAIMCDRVLFPWMIANTDKCIDYRGEKYLRNTLDEIGQAMGCNNAEEASFRLEEFFQDLELQIPNPSSNEFDELKTSVNLTRLENHPIAINEQTIDYLYHIIFLGSENESSKIR